MLLWCPLRRNEVYGFLYLRRNSFFIALEWGGLPLHYLALYLRPEFQCLGVSVGIRTDHIACGRDDKLEAELIKSALCAVHWNRAALK